jgi:hypothetical protein
MIGKLIKQEDRWLVEYTEVHKLNKNELKTVVRNLPITGKLPNKFTLKEDETVVFKQEGNGAVIINSTNSYSKIKI